jgi:hypothetical protein
MVPATCKPLVGLPEAIPGALLVSHCVLLPVLVREFDRNLHNQYKRGCIMHAFRPDGIDKKPECFAQGTGSGIVRLVLQYSLF